MELGMAAALGRALRWTGVGGSTAFRGTASLSASLLDRRGAVQYACMLEWSREGLRIAGVRVCAEGLEQVLRDRPQIFFSSHSGFADICVLVPTSP